MIQPQLYKDSVVVINPQIASRASIDSLKKALVFNVTDGLGQPAKSDKVLVAGMQGTSSLSTNEDSTKDMYAVEFCGYFLLIILSIVSLYLLIRLDYLQVVD